MTLTTTQMMKRGTQNPDTTARTTHQVPSSSSGSAVSLALGDAVVGEATSGIGYNIVSVTGTVSRIEVNSDSFDYA